MNFWDMFLSFFFAFIAKDIYDIFIQNHIKKILHKSKFFMKITGNTLINISEKGE